MLVLSRFRGESIVMTTAEGRTEIKILAVGKYGKVQLGIVAPKDVAVNRTEIQLRVDKERKGTTNGVKSHLSS